MESADTRSRAVRCFSSKWGVAAIFGFSIAFFGFFFDYGLAVFDEGVLLQGIQLEAEGRMDFAKFLHYSSQYQWFALLFPDGRPDLEVVRAVWVVVRAATAALIFLISARIVTMRWAVVPVVLFLAMPGPWHKAWVAFTLCLCLYAMVHVLERQTVSRYVFVALSIAFTYAVHPYTAVPTLVAWVTLVMVTSEMRLGPLQGHDPILRLVLWHGSFVLALIIGTFALADSIREVNPLTLGTQNASLILSIASGSRFFATELVRGLSDPKMALTLSMYLMILPVLGFSALYAVRSCEERGGRAKRISVFCLVIVGIFNLSKWAVRLDFAHFLQNAAPIWILLVFITSGLLKREERDKPVRRVIGVLVCTWIVGVISYGVTSSDTFVGGIGTRLFTENVDLPHPHGVLHVKPEVRDSLQRLEQAIRENSRPEDPVLICAFPKILYYLADRRSPLIVPVIAFPSSVLPNPDEEMVAEVRKKETAVVLFSDNPIIPREEYRLSNLAPALFRLVTSEYQMVEEIDGIQVRVPGL